MENDKLNLLDVLYRFDYKGLIYFVKVDWKFDTVSYCLLTVHCGLLTWNLGRYKDYDFSVSDVYTLFREFVRQRDLGSSFESG